MSSNRLHTVLLGAAGTGISFASASALRRQWGENLYIVAADTMPRHLATCSLLADAYVQVPAVTDPSFKAVLLEIIETYGVDTYAPLPPEEILLASGLREEGGFPGSLTLLVPSSAVSQITSDKLQTALWLGENAIPTPQTSPADNPFPAEKYFFKPRNGKGSQGTKILFPAEILQMNPDVLAGGVVQDICDLPEVTVDVFFDDRSDFVASVCRERLATTVGVSTKARLFRDSVLENIANQLARKLPLTGSFCFQVMRYHNQWAVTDINPRPGAGTAMSQATGNDFSAATFAYSWGEKTSHYFKPLEHELYVTRQYSDFIMA